MGDSNDNTNSTQSEYIYGYTTYGAAGEYRISEEVFFLLDYSNCYMDYHNPKNFHNGFKELADSGYSRYCIHDKESTKESSFLRIIWIKGDFVIKGYEIQDSTYSNGKSCYKLIKK